MRHLAFALVALAVIVAPAAASPSGDWWFKSPDGAAYCGFDDRGWTCMRPVDGFWVRFVFGRREDNVDVRKGESEMFVGYRGPAARTLGFGRIFATSDTAVITCWSRRTGVTCKHYLGLSFTLGRERGHRIFYDAAGFPPNVTPLFKASQGIYCGIDEDNLEPSQPILHCWQPANGLVLGVGYASRRGSHGRSEQAIGFRPHGYRTLAYGATFEWRCRKITPLLAEMCSTREGEPIFTCTSMRARLTCKNRLGHGFWGSARSFYTF